MRRVVVLGPGGAGKSALASALSRRLGLPVVHLDVFFYRPGWAPAPETEAVERVTRAVAEETWILDGNFLRHAAQDGRFERADTVIFLDLPRVICLWRVLRRLVRDRRRSRPDLPAGCGESFDPEGLRWIWRYHREDRPEVLRILSGLGPRVDVHRLRSRADVRRFLGTNGVRRPRPG